MTAWLAIGAVLFLAGAMGFVGWMLANLIRDPRAERQRQAPARRTPLWVAIALAAVAFEVLGRNRQAARPTLTGSTMANQLAHANSSPLNRAIEFVRGLAERYNSYHDHKEAMAYAGLTVYVAAFGTALVTRDWPPNWLGRPWSVLAAITVAWLVVLIYLRFQLTRRRWAALRVAGIERLLASWINNPPAPEDLRVWQRPQPNDTERWARPWAPLSAIARAVLNSIVPLKAAVLAVDVNEEVYPRALVEAWRAQSERGTSAISHERLVLWTGWLLYLALLVRTAYPNGLPSWALELAAHLTR